MHIWSETPQEQRVQGKRQVHTLVTAPEAAPCKNTGLMKET